MAKKENWEDQLREMFYEDKISTERGAEAVKLRRIHVVCKQVIGKYRIALLLYSIVLFALSYALFEFWGAMLSLAATLGIGASVLHYEEKLHQIFLDSYDPNWFMPD